jgi:hypothetical protein
MPFTSFIKARHQTVQNKQVNWKGSASGHNQQIQFKKQMIVDIIKNQIKHIILSTVMNNAPGIQNLWRKDCFISNLVP